MKKNIFVIGDLVIDHTVFVRARSQRFRAKETGQVYSVLRRQDSAGGAANTARMVAVLNDGPTYLWGVLGPSRWGSFRSILQSSQLLDGAALNIELRGVSDETDAPITTVTRLVVSNEDGTFERQSRFDDADQVHLTDLKRSTVMYHLAHANAKHPLDAIVINDLDRKSLTPELVAEIGRFATQKHIPLFVDPKRDRAKYAQPDVRGTAILPNLEEWCHLVDEQNRYTYWRDGLDNAAVLAEMAVRTFFFLPNFKYYFITCDTAGTVIIAPHQQSHGYRVYRAEKGRAEDQHIDSPIGCGDVVTGALAFEYDARREGQEGTPFVLSAFAGANAAVGCYCDMPWHRMPARELIDRRLRERSEARPTHLVDVPSGMRYLAGKGEIVLSAHESAIRGFYTTDDKAKASVSRILEWLLGEKGTLKSGIIGAPSGTGKSTLLSGLLVHLRAHQLSSRLCDKASFSSLSTKPVDAFVSWLQERDQAIPSIVLVDEAYGSHFESKELQDILQWAHDNGVRFLFLDSEFASDKHPRIRPDIASRCHDFQIPSVLTRPADVPLMVASKFLECAEKNGANVIRVQQNVVRLATDAILSGHHVRNVLDACAQAYKRASNSSEVSATVVTLGDCDGTLDYSDLIDPGAYPTVYTITRSFRATAL